MDSPFHQKDLMSSLGLIINSLIVLIILLLIDENLTLDQHPTSFYIWDSPLNYGQKAQKTSLQHP
jgi:hypothetical protein